MPIRASVAGLRTVLRKRALVKSLNQGVVIMI